MRPDNTTLRNTLRFRFSGLIWRIKISDRLIAIETRSSGTQEVSFSVFDYTNGNTCFIERTYPDRGELTLAYVDENIALLHVFSGADIPERKGIICISSLSGEVIWERYNIAAEHFQDDGILAFDPRVTPRRYTWISPSDGQAIPDKMMTADTADVIMPRLIERPMSPVDLSASNIVGACHQLSHSGKEILSFHTRNDVFFEQQLYVYEGESLILKEILASGIQKLQPEAFFIRHDYLFYVKDKQEIVAYFV